MATLLAQAQPRDSGALVGDDWVGEGVQVAGSDDRVMVESLDAQQAPVGVEADLPQRGQIHKTLPDLEVVGVVDRGLGPQRSSFLVVRLDGGVFVVHVQARGDAICDDPGAETSRGTVTPATDDAALEDQTDLVGAPDVQVVPDHLFEEDPPRHRTVEHLGQGELSLQDRYVVPVPGGAVGVSERVGQDRQPLVQQRVDLLGSESVTDLL